MNSFKRNVLKEHGRDFKVLFYEPNTEIRNKFIEEISICFTNISIASSADNALDLLKDNYFELVLVNTKIKDMDIDDFCSNVKLLEDKTHIILLSREKEDTHLGKLINIGISGYLSFPLKEDEVIDVLCKIVNEIVDVKMLCECCDSCMAISEEIEKTQCAGHENFSECKSKLEITAFSDTRHHSTDTMCAADFMSKLDNTIIDKVEGFLDELDTFAIMLYDMEEMDSLAAYFKINEISRTIEIFEKLISEMLVFRVIGKSFAQLLNFFKTLKPEDLEDKNKKNLFIEYLLYLERDLQMWIKTIFLEQSTTDIRYFDDSFANSCFEIERIFAQQEVIIDDDEHVEFF